VPLRFRAFSFDQTAGFPDDMLPSAGRRCILVIVAPADVPLTTPPHPRQLGDRRWTKCKSFGQWWWLYRRIAHDKQMLEQTVQERTGELRGTNERLVQEIEDRTNAEQ